MIDNIIYGLGLITLSCLGGALAIVLSFIAIAYKESAIFLGRVRRAHYPKPWLIDPRNESRTLGWFEQAWITLRLWHKYAWNPVTYMIMKGTRERIYWPGETEFYDA